MPKLAVMSAPGFKQVPPRRLPQTAMHYSSLPKFWHVGMQDVGALASYALQLSPPSGHRSQELATQMETSERGVCMFGKNAVSLRREGKQSKYPSGSDRL